MQPAASALHGRPIAMALGVGAPWRPRLPTASRPLPRPFCGIIASRCNLDGEPIDHQRIAMHKMCLFYEVGSVNAIVASSHRGYYRAIM